MTGYVYWLHVISKQKKAVEYASKVTYRIFHPALRASKGPLKRADEDQWAIPYCPKMLYKASSPL